jgi:hypothetical protein
MRVTTTRRRWTHPTYRTSNNSASETTLNQLMDMFVVILGILGAGLVTWMYISAAPS